MRRTRASRFPWSSPTWACRTSTAARRGGDQGRGARDARHHAHRLGTAPGGTGEIPPEVARVLSKPPRIAELRQILAIAPVHKRKGRRESPGARA